MRKSLLAVVLILLCLLLAVHLIMTAPLASRKALRAQLNPNYIRAMAAYKRLEPKLPREELRAVTTIGILNGAAQVERQMEEHLIDVVSDLLDEAKLQNNEQRVMPKIDEIERQLWRDQRALQILTSAMDLVTRKKGVADFKSEMHEVLQEVRQHKNNDDSTQNSQQQQQQQHQSQHLPSTAGVEIDGAPLGNRIANLRKNIQKQVDMMKEMVEHKIEHTLDYLIDEADDDGLLGKASHKVLRKRQTKNDNAPEVPAEIRMIDSILTEADFRHNLIENGVERRKDEFESLEDEFTLDENKETVKQNVTNNTAVTASTTPKPKTAKQEELDTSDNNGEANGEGGGGGGGGGGGLVGLIGSLSGGEGGSDVGALIGALTGLISTLFGPGGLDLESLISTGTSLISGLLAGDKNFGTVLGIYVGTAFDGLSGGGGAINNGQFIGNFLGTVVASLSADPEDDDEPPKPFLFAQNVISSFLEAKNRKGSNEETGDRHDKKKGDMGGGSDSGGFIKQIVAHVVSNVISVILNASLGASGGASQASHSLFSGSSSQHGKH